MTALLRGGERGNVLRVIRDRVEHTAAGHHGHAGTIHIGAEQVGAMAGRVHPLVVNSLD